MKAQLLSGSKKPALPDHSSATVKDPIDGREWSRVGVSSSLTPVNCETATSNRAYVKRGGVELK